MSKTTLKFKPGDKVHVYPGKYSCIPYYIRATITDIDEMGYFLRAFRKDLPGIWMFNIWDDDLVPRSGKDRMPNPDVI